MRKDGGYTRRQIDRAPTDPVGPLPGMPDMKYAPPPGPFSAVLRSDVAEFMTKVFFGAEATAEGILRGMVNDDDSQNPPRTMSRDLTRAEMAIVKWMLAEALAAADATMDDATSIDHEVRLVIFLTEGLSASHMSNRRNIWAKDRDRTQFIPLIVGDGELYVQFTTDNASVRDTDPVTVMTPTSSVWWWSVLGGARTWGPDPRATHALGCRGGGDPKQNKFNVKAAAIVVFSGRHTPACQSQRTAVANMHITDAPVKGMIWTSPPRCRPTSNVGYIMKNKDSLAAERVLLQCELLSSRPGSRHAPPRATFLLRKGHEPTVPVWPTVQPGDVVVLCKAPWDENTVTVWRKKAVGEGRGGGGAGSSGECAAGPASRAGRGMRGGAGGRGGNRGRVDALGGYPASGGSGGSAVSTMPGLGLGEYESLGSSGGATGLGAGLGGGGADAGIGDLGGLDSSGGGVIPVSGKRPPPVALTNPALPHTSGGALDKDTVMALVADAVERERANGARALEAEKGAHELAMERAVADANARARDSERNAVAAERAFLTQQHDAEIRRLTDEHKSALAAERSATSVSTTAKTTQLADALQQALSTIQDLRRDQRNLLEHSRTQLQALYDSHAQQITKEREAHASALSAERDRYDRMLNNQAAERDLSRMRSDQVDLARQATAGTIAVALAGKPVPASAMGAPAPIPLQSVGVAGSVAGSSAPYPLPPPPGSTTLAPGGGAPIMHCIPVAPVSGVPQPSSTSTASGAPPMPPGSEAQVGFKLDAERMTANASQADGVLQSGLQLLAGLKL